MTDQRHGFAPASLAIVASYNGRETDRNMTDEEFDFRGSSLRELLPWIALFRAFQIALDPKKIILGGAGALLMSLGWLLIAWVFEPGPLAEPPPLAEGATVEQSEEYEADKLDYLADQQLAAELDDAARLPWVESKSID